MQPTRSGIRQNSSATNLRTQGILANPTTKVSYGVAQWESVASEFLLSVQEVCDGLRFF